MAPASFFTPEMGARLRKLRVEAHLTQDEVADRMGIAGPGRRIEVWRLEAGRPKSPTLEKIALYLRACDAHWSEFTDLLMKPETLPIDMSSIEKSGFTRQIQARLKPKTERQTREYNRKLTMPRRFTPRGKKPRSPKQRRTMALRLQNYRIVANIVEEDAREIVSFRPDVPAIEVGFYKCVARQVLGTFWRRAKTVPNPSTSRQKKKELPDIQAELAARTGHWVEIGLIESVVKQIQQQTVRRILQLQSSHSQLFPAPEQQPGLTEKSEN